MTATTIRFQVAARDISPRGARPLGEIAAHVFRAVGRFFVQGAERQGARRAAQELRQMAFGFDGSQPERAAELRAAAARCEALLDARG